MPNLKSYSQPPTPDLSAIIAMLTDAVQALRNVSCPSEPEELPDKEIVPADEIRCYRFSPLAVRCEQELFAEQQAKNLHDLFFKASSSITAFTALLEHIDAEAEVEGVVIHILARELRRVEDLLFKIQDTYSTVEPVEA
ncbi:MAG: glycosyl transferase [Desulfovibrio sp.]|uniref:glycosyl transferase n=1 Tax=Desulfovibrio sp. TaxID=885 RepID=UPI0039E5560B